MNKLKEGWCCCIPDLNQINVSSSNLLFKLVENKILVKDNYNLVFCVRNVEEVTIPSYIECISSYAFNQCSSLKKVEFENNSKLKIIGQNAFSETCINKIKIPSSVASIGKYCFQYSESLRMVEFPTDCKITTMDDYLFSYTIIERIRIPSQVTLIKNPFPGSIRRIKFPKDSKLQIIDKDAICISRII